MTAQRPAPAWKFPSQPIATPVFALELGESMSKQVRVCRALRVLYGSGITWHSIGDHIVYFTPGDHCGCHDCAQRLAHITKGMAHA